jgi:hypothetical protein
MERCPPRNNVGVSGVYAVQTTQKSSSIAELIKNLSVPGDRPKLDAGVINALKEAGFSFRTIFDIGSDSNSRKTACLDWNRYKPSPLVSGEDHKVYLREKKSGPEGTPSLYLVSNEQETFLGNYGFDDICHGLGILSPIQEKEVLSCRQIISNNDTCNAPYLDMGMLSFLDRAQELAFKSDASDKRLGLALYKEFFSVRSKNMTKCPEVKEALLMYDYLEQKRHGLTLKIVISNLRSDTIYDIDKKLDTAKQQLDAAKADVAKAKIVFERHEKSCPFTTPGLRKQFWNDLEVRAYTQAEEDFSAANEKLKTAQKEYDRVNSANHRITCLEVQLNQMRIWEAGLPANAVSATFRAWF